MKDRLKFNKFIFLLFVAIGIAYLFPQGITQFPLKTITDVGIGFIFLFYGLKLSPAEFRLGFLNYKSHILIQCTTFIIFPLIAFAFIPFFEGGMSSNLWISLFFLAALPSTVSSSIVMVALAKGNLPTAIFNASLSGLIGIVATPLWLSLFINNETNFHFGDVVIKLFLQIILPLIIGLVLQQKLGNYARKHSTKLAMFDKFIILLIVYSSFSVSFLSNLFETIATKNILLLAGLVTFLFFFVYFLIGILCKILGFNLRDTITAKFCGTKKSLVHGSVMVNIIFGFSANTGLFLLPIMMYHTLQLLVIAVFAENYRKENQEKIE